MKCLILLVVLLVSGCTRFNQRANHQSTELLKVTAQIEQKIAVNTMATGLALQAAPQTNRAVRVAQAFNEKAKVLLPQPEYGETIRYQGIVAGLLSENETDRTSAQKALGEKDSEILRLQSDKSVISGRIKELELELIDYGKKYELERNKSWGRRMYAFLGFGGVIALAVAFPIFIPIAGQIVSWIVGLVPSLASWIGLVGRKSFDSVLIGVESAKEKMKANGAQGVTSLLKDELNKSTDSAHRRLIAARKQSLNI